MDRKDWRRMHINNFIKRLHTEIHKIKPHVKFGISPFGIWRPGYPKQIKGLDAYGTLYANARLWLREGWLDYCAPQLYWRIDPPLKVIPCSSNGGTNKTQTPLPLARQQQRQGGALAGHGNTQPN